MAEELGTIAVSTSPEPGLLDLYASFLSVCMTARHYAIQHLCRKPHTEAQASDSQHSYPAQHHVTASRLRQMSF